MIHNMMMPKALQVEFIYTLLYTSISHLDPPFVLSTKAVCFLDMICQNAVDQIVFKKGF